MMKIDIKMKNIKNYKYKKINLAFMNKLLMIKKFN